MRLCNSCWNKSLSKSWLEKQDKDCSSLQVLLVLCLISPLNEAIVQWAGMVLKFEKKFYSMNKDTYSILRILYRFLKDFQTNCRYLCECIFTLCRRVTYLSDAKNLEKSISLQALVNKSFLSILMFVTVWRL